LQKSLCKAASPRKLTKQSAVADHEPVLTFIVSTGFLF
jgi:hypothetical protein